MAERGVLYFDNGTYTSTHYKQILSEILSNIFILKRCALCSDLTYYMTLIPLCFLKNSSRNHKNKI